MFLAKGRRVATGTVACAGSPLHCYVPQARETACVLRAASSAATSLLLELLG